MHDLPFYLKIACLYLWKLLCGISSLIPSWFLDDIAVPLPDAETESLRCQLDLRWCGITWGCGDRLVLTNWVDSSPPASNFDLRAGGCKIAVPPRCAYLRCKRLRKYPQSVWFEYFLRLGLVYGWIRLIRPTSRCSIFRNQLLELRCEYQSGQESDQRCVFGIWSQQTLHKYTYCVHSRAIRRGRGVHNRKIVSW